MSDIYDPVGDSEASDVTIGESAHLIRARLRAKPVPGASGMRLHLAHSGSGLSRLAVLGCAAPYWAYPWAGGLALVRYIQDHPETVMRRRVIDFGAGSGLVAIAAARTDATRVVAVETDPIARAAIAANAALNRVEVEIVHSMPEPTPGIDLILAGDVFYAGPVARRSLKILDHWRTAGIAALIGDPFRTHLPRERLRWLAEYRVSDMGSGGRDALSGVFALEVAADADPVAEPL